MSRSRKKLSIFRHATPGMKRTSNKKVRQFIKSMKTLIKGKWYRKVLNPWDIHDWVCKPEIHKYTNEDLIKKGYRK
jgi:hypothetical protein